MSTLLVKFRVRTSISTGKATVHLSNISESIESAQSEVATRSDGNTINAANTPETGAIHPYDFYVGAWMGDDNPHIQFEMLKAGRDGTGSASLSVPVLAGDTDTFKIGCYIRDPKTKMMRHLASGFQGLDWLKTAIDGVSSFEQAKTSLLLKDNYSKNQVLFHFHNDGTDTAALQALLPKLRRSELRNNQKINQAVFDMATGVHHLIESISSVSNSNGGPNFINNLCFTQSMGCAINYPLLDMTYTSDRHLMPLSLLSYMSLATLHYTGQSASDALRQNNHDFVQKFVVPLCTSFTVCPGTMKYSGDMTLSAKGNLDQATEDFSMVMCSHFYKDVKDMYTDRFKGVLAEMSNLQLREHTQTALAQKVQTSFAHPLIADDCETLSGLGKSIEGGIYHEAVTLAGGDCAKLGQRMWDCTRGLQNLASVPREDFHDCAKLLCRYGALRENFFKSKTPYAQLGLCIVSAKGASFSTSNCDLNGHACTIAQSVEEDGKASYFIGEGTSNVRMRDLPDTCPQKVSIVLSSGAKLLSTTEALGIIAQNMGELLSTQGLTRIEQTIPQSFASKDPYCACPFYMAGFFVGLKMGETVPGVIPLDTKHRDHSKAVLAEGVSAGCDALGPPMFGAPVVTLSDDSVSALPINLGRAMGPEPARAFLSCISRRNRESYPPRATSEVLTMLASRWGDLERLPKQSRNCGWTLACAEGFDNADLLRAVGEYKRRLSREFNALQDKDPLSDGIKMSVSLHMLSVVAHFAVPLPTGERWNLTCARNMRLALKALPFEAGALGLKSEFGCSLV